MSVPSLEQCLLADGKGQEADTQSDRKGFPADTKHIRTVTMTEEREGQLLRRAVQAHYQVCE